MLLGEFYKIVESGKEGQSLSAKVQFNKEHAIFKGHFPELPVVPGVCQTQMLGEILSQILDKPLEMVKASHIKFLALLNPAEYNLLEIAIRITGEEKGNVIVDANYFWGDKTFFRFKGEYQ